MQVYVMIKNYCVKPLGGLMSALTQLDSSFGNEVCTLEIHCVELTPRLCVYYCVVQF